MIVVLSLQIVVMLVLLCLTVTNSSRSDSDSAAAAVTTEQHATGARPSHNAMSRSSSGDGLVWTNFSASVQVREHKSFDKTDRSSTRSSIDENNDDDDHTTNNNNKKKKHTKKLIVHPFSGYVPNGKICAILGPSGSGKTTFLSALACSTRGSSSSPSLSNHHYPSSSMITIDGTIVLSPSSKDGDGEIHEEETTGVHHQKTKEKQQYRYQNTVAWLQQDDEFFNTLSVMETLRVAVYLELPQLSYQKREQIVITTLQSLGLGHYADQFLVEENDNDNDNNNKIDDVDNDNKTRRRHRNRKRKSRKKLASLSPSSSSIKILSGGERRRVSIAQELVSTPKLIIADEPTSGLDTNLGDKVVRLLKDVVVTQNRNIPCICSIHQPKSSTWKLFDYCILMASHGRVCYIGRRDAALDYFASLGYPCPKETNPAEFFLDLLSIDTDTTTTDNSNQQSVRDEHRIHTLHHACLQYQQHQHEKRRKYDNAQPKDMQRMTMKKQQRIESSLVPPQQNNSSSNNNNSNDNDNNNNPVLNSVRRVGCLFRRALRQNIRNHLVNTFRFVAGIGNALLFAQIFPSIGSRSSSNINTYTARSVADRVALLSFGVINMCMMAYMKSLETFGNEKGIIEREQRRNLYYAVEYLLAKALAELPLDALFVTIFTATLKFSTPGIRISFFDLTSVFAIMTMCGASLGYAISSWVPSSSSSCGGNNNSSGSATTTIGLPVIIILLVVGIINPSGVDTIHDPPPSKLIRILKYLSPIASAIQALCIGEFRGMEFDSSSSLAGDNDTNTMGQAVGRRLFSTARRHFTKLRDLPKMGALALVQNGDQVLQALGLQDMKYTIIIKHMIKLTGINLTIAWIGLVWHNNKQNVNNIRSKQKQRQRRKGWNTISRMNVWFRYRISQVLRLYYHRRCHLPVHHAASDRIHTTTSTSNKSHIHEEISRILYYRKRHYS